MQKRIAVLMLLLVIASTTASCIQNAPEGVAVSTSYPRDDFPIYNSSVVFEYNKYVDGFSLKAGSNDSVDDIANFYRIFFGEDVSSNSANAYMLSGYHNGYLYDIDIGGAQRWDERAFQSIFSIDIEQLDVDLGSEPDTVWQCELGGGRSAHGMAACKDGGFILAGETSQEPGATGDGGEVQSPVDGWVAKLNDSGTVQWERTVGGDGVDHIGFVIQSNDGGFLLCGYTNSTGNGVSGWHKGEENGVPTMDIWVVKLDAGGNMLWQRCLGGSGWEYPSGISQQVDGGIIILGETTSVDGDAESWAKRNGALSPGNNIWVVKLSAQGVFEWENSFGGSKRDFADSFVVADDGSVVLCGQTSSSDGDVSGWHQGATETGGATKDVWIVSLDSKGKIGWQRVYGTEDNETGYCIEKTADGGYIVGASKYAAEGDTNGSGDNYDYWLLKLSSDGRIEWDNSFGGNGYDDIGIVLVSSDGYLAIGETSSSDTEGWHEGYDGDGQALGDIWAVKVSAQGDIQWQLTLGGSGAESLINSIKTLDGGYLLLGQTRSSDGDVSGWHQGYSDGVKTSNVWLVKLSQTGEIGWERAFGNAYEDSAAGLAGTSDNGYYLAANWSLLAEATASYNAGLWSVKLEYPEIIK